MARIFNFNEERKRKMNRGYNIFQIANVLLSIESMTPKKLQKMCYYAYSWFRTLYGEDLFENDFEAWVHGPVAPELYNFYREYKWREIPQRELNEEIDDDIIEFIHGVYESYGHLSGDQLEYLTHNEDPWLIAREGLADYEPSNNRIEDNVIEQYYQRVFEDGQGE